MNETLRTIEEETRARIEEAESQEALDEVRVSILGKKGRLTQILKGMKEIRILEFTPDDVVRHPLVQKIIERYAEES